MKQKPNKYFDKAQLSEFGLCVAFKGTEGDIVLRLNDPDYEVNSMEPMLVEIDGCLVPFFIEEEKTLSSFEYYSDLDELGRAGVAFANISAFLSAIES